MTHLQQPEGSSLCGQTCVAMAAGVTISESIKAFGTKGGTRTKQMVAALRHFGLKPKTEKLVRWDGVSKPPDYAILKLRWDAKDERHRGHWILNWAGMVYDPMSDGPGCYNGNVNSRFTAYLELEPPNVL